MLKWYKGNLQSITENIIYDFVFKMHYILLRYVINEALKLLNIYIYDDIFNLRKEDKHHKRLEEIISHVMF